MDFDPGAGVDNTLDIDVAAGAPFRLSLAWAEARFGVSDDFDVYAFNPNTSGTISAFGKEDNLVSQDPTEFAAFTVGGAGGRQIVIRRYAGTGTPRLKLVSNDNGANTITRAAPPGRVRSLRRYREPDPPPQDSGQGRNRTHQNRRIEHDPVRPPPE